jgi:hypothetical protein
VSVGQLPRALALNAAMLKIAVIGGPALGGFLYAAGAVVVYGLSAAVLAVSLAFVASIRGQGGPAQPEPVSLASMFAGFAFIRRNEVVLGALSLDLFAVLLGGATALLPLYAKDVLHTGAWGLGLLAAAPAVGGVAISVVLARSPLKTHVGRWMFGSVAVFGVATLVFAVSTVFVVSFAALAVGGAADMVSVVIRQSLVQLETPDELRGRVSAVNSTFIGASNQLGEFRAGAAAEWFGAVASVLMGAFATLAVVAIWMRWFPALAKRDKLGPS